MTTKSQRKLPVAILASIAAVAFGGTVINTNLPAGDTIVNIGGTTDGAASFGGPNQDLWFQPFNSSGSLLEVTLQPGTYSFRLLSATDEPENGRKQNGKYVTIRHLYQRGPSYHQASREQG